MEIDNPCQVIFHEGICCILQRVPRRLGKVARKNAKTQWVRLRECIFVHELHKLHKLVRCRSPYNFKTPCDSARLRGKFSAYSYPRKRQEFHQRHGELKTPCDSARLCGEFSAYSYPRKREVPRGARNCITRKSENAKGSLPLNL